MKLRRSLLQKFIDLPTIENRELRTLLDEAGLEVKDITSDADPTFTIETLANRGDHLSAFGIARELSARLLTQVKLPSLSPLPEDKKVSLPVHRLTDKCPRYALLEMTLPEAMRSRPEVTQLIGASDRHPIVDLLNFVQLEIGQPMHAFDREKVEGEIIIDTLQAPEKIIALDGKEYEVPVNSIVIKDKRKVLAVAGIIGCENSMVTPETRRVVIESAHFDPVQVRITRKHMGLLTEASHVFERGADIEMVSTALRRVIYLAQGAVKDDTTPHVVGYSIQETKSLERQVIPLRYAAVKLQVNLPRLAESEISLRLKYLGYGFQHETKQGVEVIIPSWRLYDVKNEMDVIEDFIKSFGLSRIKPELPSITAGLASLNDHEIFTSKVEPILLGNGFSEVFTKGFYSEEVSKLISKLWPASEKGVVRLKNSFEKANSTMKVTNVIHLAELALKNTRHGRESVKVYELNRFFNARQEVKEDDWFPYEKFYLSGICCGNWSRHPWAFESSREEKLLRMKGMIESICAALGQEMTIGSAKHPLLHPGVQTSIKFGTIIVGYIGLVHPDICEYLKAKSDLIYFEIDEASALKASEDIQYGEPIRYPSVVRDITLQVGQQMPAEMIVRTLKSMNLPVLQRCDIVNLFKKPDEDFRRITYRLNFRLKERTLLSSEVDEAISSILERVKTENGVVLAA